MPRVLPVAAFQEEAREHEPEPAGVEAQQQAAARQQV